MADRVGQRLDDYGLVRLLGAGGFGEVYLAEHVYRKKQVAIKVLPQLAEGELHAFLNEARTIRLRHPNIVQILDFGVDNRTPFVVMEYAPNGTLRQRHPKGTRLPLDTIVSYVKQVAGALQYAHDEKLIHRDVKPENILLGSDNQLLLSDFGIATIARSSLSQSTQTMAGTVVYMAPEQIQGRPTLASDQYALAVIVYEWLSGERPFRGTVLEIASQHMLAPPPSLHEKIPAIPADVEQVVMTALTKDPKSRFASVQAFANALEQACKPELSRPAVPTSVPPLLTTPIPASPSLSSRPEEDSSAIALSSPALSSSPPPLQSMPNTAQPFSTSPSSPPMENAARTPSGPQWSPVGSLGSSEGISIVPQPAVAPPRRSRSRLFYPMLVISILLILAIVSSGVYYFFSGRAGTDVERQLHTAENLLMQSRGEISTQPAAALQHLAQAQNILRSLQKASPTPAQSNKINSLLHTDLTNEVKAAITSYNQLALISLLPCTTTPVTAINEGNTTQTIALTQATDTRGAVVTYVQGQDNHLYLLDAQNHLSNPQALPDGGQVLAMAGDGPRLFVLSQVTKANTPPAFDLIQLTPGQSGVQTTIKLSGQLVPKFLTAWGSDVYVVLVSSSASTTIQILDYTADKLTDAPRSRSITAANLVSVAAFPGHLLFLLLADGSVQSLQFLDQTQPPAAVLVPSAIASPLAITASEFTPAKDVPKVASVTQTKNTPLIVRGTPGTVMLAAGSINAGATVPHLYVVDTPNHRILDLAQMSSTAKSTEVQAPTPPITGSPPGSSTGVGGTAVSSPAGNTVTLSLVTQYVSNALFAQARSLSVDPKGTGVAVLIDQFPSTRSLVSIPTSMKTVCSS